MLEKIRIIAAIAFITVGVIFAVTSVIGVFRFKYVLNRMHSAAMGDTLAILFVLVGLVILSGFNFTSLKLLAIIFFFWLAGPVSSHLIANLVRSVDEANVPEVEEIDNIDKVDNIFEENKNGKEFKQ
ncbi:MAG: monovalent cation/H(+) antiporter subunit G [Lachnospiraceae bacterium]|nr:monovalent cation/H(+) antiporter subunit G [Lachnospiraceae bacterium]